MLVLRIKPPRTAKAEEILNNQQSSTVILASKKLLLMIKVMPQTPFMTVTKEQNGVRVRVWALYMIVIKNANKIQANL